MSRALRFAMAVAIMAGFTAGAGAQAPATQKAPAAIEAAFKKAYPNATIKNVMKETLEGKTVYEVESVDNGKGRNIDYNPDGSIVVIEDELTEAEFPPAVAAAIAKRYPKATIGLREKLTITKGSLTQYEAELKGAGSVVEVVLTVDGTWVLPKVLPKP